MPFKKYNSSNNAIAALNLPLSDTDTTMVLKGNYWRFSTSNFIVKVTKKVGWVVTARENIYVTTRTGATCTGLTRAYEPVPVDDNAATNVLQALEFDTDDIVEQVISSEFLKDIQDALSWKLESVAWLRTWFWVDKHVRVNRATWAEESKAVTTWAGIVSTDIFRVEEAAGTYKDIAYSILQAEISASSWGSATITPYESTIILNDLVWITEDGLFECQTENASSANITGSTINVLIWQTNLDDSRTLFLFSVTTQAYACVGTLTGNTMVYGTAVSVATIASNNFSGWCALIDTDKVAIVTNDTGTQVVRNRIATISGNVVTLGTEYQQTLSVGGGNNNVITWVVKVRTTAYAWSWRTAAWYYNATYVQTVSGTVVTTNNTAINPAPTGNAGTFVSQNVVYLQDNRIAMVMYNNNADADFRAYIFDVNPAGTNASTTYSHAGALWGQVSWAWLARLNSTEFVITYWSIVQAVDKFSVPPSGTTLVRTSAFVAALWSFYPVVEISTGYFGVVIWTTVNVYNIKGVLVWTITGITALPYYRSIKMRDARFVYLNWANWTTRIINFARVFKAWVATNATGWVKFYWVHAFAWVLPNELYYIQDNGTIWTTPTLYPIWRWIAAWFLLIW